MKTNTRTTSVLFCSGIALLILAIPVVLFAVRAAWISTHIGTESDLRVVSVEVTPPTRSGARFINFGFASPNEPSRVIRLQAVAGNESTADALLAKYQIGTIHRITTTTSEGIQVGIFPESRYEIGVAFKMLFGSVTLPLLAVVLIMLGRDTSPSEAPVVQP